MLKPCFRAAAILMLALLAKVPVTLAATEAASTPPELSVEGGPPTVRLISDAQYLNAIAYIFGPDVAPSLHFPPLRRTEGLLALGSKSAGVTAGAVQAYEAVAQTIAANVVDPHHRTFLIGCMPKVETKRDDRCATQVIARYGRLLFRRPLSKAEVKAYVDIAGSDAETLNDFYSGLSSSLSALLVSPEFLYFVETEERDPHNPKNMRLTGQAKAMRLSLLLWNAPPDEELLEAAERGQLQTREGLSKQVDRMLASPRMESGLRAFFDDMFIFEGFNALAKDAIIYPAFTQGAVEAAREQTLRTVIDHLVARNGDYRDLFTTRHTFLNSQLSPLYKLPVEQGGDWVAYDLPADAGRGGLLSEISFLALNSHPGRSSPTRRGRAVREIFLCQKVPDPPPNVDFSKFEDAAHSAKTARGRLAEHATNPVCAGCHKITDPLGLALENFDGAGEFRRTEGNELIDASGSLNGVSFSDADGLGKAIHDSPEAPRCLVQRLYAYGLGYKPGTDQRAWLEELDKRFAAHGYRIVDLLHEIVTSPAFYAVTAPKSGEVVASNGS
jgi:hypothetical protein